VKYPYSPTVTDGQLPQAANGQRYLIVNDIGTNTTASLQLANDVSLPVGTTVIPILDSFDTTDFNAYIGKSVSCIIENNISIFNNTPSVTTIVSINPPSGSAPASQYNPWTMTVSKGTTNVVPPTYHVTRDTNGNVTGGYTTLVGTVNTNLQITTQAWGNLVASANDIIQYNGTEWVVATDSTTNTNIDFVTNTTTDIQYRWSNGQWSKSYEGWYAAGDWSVVI
jgi:hypothetical protein